MQNGYAAVYSPGKYKDGSLRFLRERLGEERARKLLGSPQSLQCPYVAAKLFLSVGDWNRYVWIEHHGSLEGFTDEERVIS